MLLVTELPAPAQLAVQQLVLAFLIVPGGRVTPGGTHADLVIKQTPDDIFSS